LALLLAAAAAALYTAVAAMRRHTEAERYARGLANELEGKRGASLSERQQSARHILDLEERVRTLEAKRGPRAVMGGRSASYPGRGAPGATSTGPGAPAACGGTPQANARAPRRSARRFTRPSPTSPCWPGPAPPSGGRSCCAGRP